MLIANNYLNFTNKDDNIAPKRNSMNQSDNCKYLQRSFPMRVGKV
jgi:hypothetical protein